MSGFIRIGDLPGQGVETVRISLDVWKGQSVCDIRTYGPINKMSSALTPLKNGLTIDPSLIPQLCALLQEAYASALAAGMIDGGADVGAF